MSAWPEVQFYEIRKVECEKCRRLIWPNREKGFPSICEPCITRLNSRDEGELIADWLPTIEKHFYVDREVWGTHFSGARVRADMVIRPKVTDEWRNKEAAFAVEWKREEKMDGRVGDTSKWFAQCFDYACTKWDNYGWIYVLIGGGLTAHPARSKSNDFQFLPRVAAHIGIGELKLDGMEGLSIVFAREHRLWTEARGPVMAKTHGLVRKWGSR